MISEKNVKRSSSGAVLNTNSKALSDYKKRRRVLRSREEKIENLESRLEKLEILIKGLIK